jgi:hypothetical protein
MGTWKGIVGKGFTPTDFERYVSSLQFGVWRPQFVVLHNTASPRLSQWHSVPGIQRMKNLEDFYKNNQQWSAGPHLFIADDLIWAFTPLTTSGVHSPSWNSISWGVEMVGDYNVEPFSPLVQNNAVAALTTLHTVLGLDPQTLRLHKEDPKTTHDCPGKHVNKADMINRILSQITDLHAGEHEFVAGDHGAQLNYIATKQHVANRGIPPNEFLDELVAWGKQAPDEIFARNTSSDIYSSVLNTLGPWQGIQHRRAVMLEVMRVLAGFESSWNWNEGRDTTNPTSVTPDTIEAGAWQVSANSMNFGQELKDLMLANAGTLDSNTFQQAMKENHSLAMEYIARLLRRTTHHNGPVLRHEIDPWLRRDAVAEFEDFLSA